MIITLCGSARFEDAFHYWNERLSLDGHLVFSLCAMPSYKGRKDWYDQRTKETLDRIHIRKIEVSDAIFVITEHWSAQDGPQYTGENTKPYIGESTRREIEYAIQNRKQVFVSRFPPPPRDAFG